jgi:hypothetical protein
MLGVGGPLACRSWAILSSRGFASEPDVSSIRSSLMILPLLSEKLSGRLSWPDMAGLWAAGFGAVDIITQRVRHGRSPGERWR